MKLKVLHLNIEGGRQLPTILSYLKKETFDLIHLQEVAGGSWSKSGNDNFAAIKDDLGYEGELAVSMRFKGEPESYFGNATFFSQSLTALQKEITWLKPYAEVKKLPRAEFTDDFIRDFPRNALSLKLEIDRKTFWSINTHLAWGPNQKDEPYKVTQGNILFEYLQTLQEPFILSGDFNVDSHSAVVKAIDTLAVNHASLAGVTNTLNPRLHRATHLFPQGLAVDFIYTSPQLSADNFYVVDHPDLSDHFGLALTIEV